MSADTSLMPIPGPVDPVPVPRAAPVRADGRVELVKEDPRWSYEMQFKAAYRSWTLEAPLTLSPGDTVRTRCRWNNTTAADLTFPREMCIGTGFFLSDGSTAPVCMNGRWVER